MIPKCPKPLVVVIMIMTMIAITIICGVDVVHGFTTNNYNNYQHQHQHHQSLHPLKIVHSTMTTTTTTTMEKSRSKPSTMMMMTPTTAIGTNPVKSKFNHGRSISSGRRRNGSTELNSLPPELWTSILPSSLGYIKSEYGFSYAYGFGTALSALSILKRFFFSATTAATIIPFLQWHAWSLVFYGFRLNTFLFVRTMFSSRQREMIQRIEDRAIERERTKGKNRFLVRTPILLSTGLLYYTLALPTMMTAKLATTTTSSSISLTVFKILIGLQWFGFGIAAIGDFTKTYVKQFQQKNEKYLVTSGIYSILRHPNYTGEIIGWTANALCGIIATILLLLSSSSSSTSKVMMNLPTAIGTIMAILFGWVGMTFVLLRATSGLEKRQQEMYGSTTSTTSDVTRYQEWVQSTWSGWMLPEKTKVPDEEPQLEFNDIVEDSGSGI